MKSKKKLKKKKLKSISTLKKKLWKIFSEYIRLAYSDKNGYCECVTCGIKKHYKEMQAGHFLAGRNNGILFEESNVRPQDLSCNVFKHGNMENYYPYMLKAIGQEGIDRLKELKNNPPKLDSSWYENKIKHYTDFLAIEKSKRNLC